MIYHYALVENTPLYITPETAPEEPALLRTCRAVRREARRIFYSQNNFQVKTQQRNIEPALKFSKQHRLPEADIEFCPYRIFLDGGDSYGQSKCQNEMRYIEAWYSGEILFNPTQQVCENSPEGGNFASHRLWDIARLLNDREIPWEVAQKVLNSAGDLVHARSGFKKHLSKSCCNAIGSAT